MSLIASPDAPAFAVSAPRIAVIGAGHLGSIHARLWLQHENATLTSVYDIHPERAQNLVAKLKEQFPQTTVFAAQSLEEALANCDAVTIATPTSSHFTVAEAALKAHKHCFIEKPIAANLAETDALLSIATKTSAIVHIGHVERFNPAFAPISPHNLHNLRYIESHRLAPFKPRALDVSVILDLMIHDIDIALWLVASPVSHISANGASMLARHTDMAVARLHFENGCAAQFHVSRLSPQTRRTMALYTAKQHITVDFAAPSLEIVHFSEHGIKPRPFATNSPELLPATMLGDIAAAHIGTAWQETPPLQPTNAISQEQQAFLAEIRAPSARVQRATHIHETRESMRIAEAITAQIMTATIS